MAGRIHRERDRDKGLGLGLSIVVQLVVLLDGHRLDFTSTPGRGSRFTVELPLAPADAARVDSSGTAPAPDPEEPESLQGAYVMLVEDDALVARAMRSMLESWGCLVEHCADLPAAARFAQHAERIPDVLLTDFRLPDDKSAYDVLQAAAEGFGRAVPAIVLSGEVGALDAIRPRVVAALIKPADRQALRRALLDCLRLGSA